MPCFTGWFLLVIMTLCLSCFWEVPVFFLLFSCWSFKITLQDSKGNEDVKVFVKVNGKEFPIGTLSVDKYPQYTTSLVFEKEFELLHTSKTSTISALGYKFRHCKRKYPSILLSSIFSKKLEHKFLFLNRFSVFYHI